MQFTQKNESKYQKNQAKELGKVTSQGTAFSIQYV